jgi:cell division protein FtsQ
MMRTHHRRRLGWGLTALTLIGGGFALVRSGATQIASVRVEGAGSLDPSVIRRASGIAPGMNAITIDLAAAATRVEALPLVEGAEVRRDGALGIVISVTERRAALTAVTPQGRRVLDRDGVEVPDVEAPRSLPEISVERSAALDAATVRATLRLWERLTAGERRRASVAWGEVHGLRVVIGRTTVRLGGGDAIATKLEAYRGVRRALQRQPRRVDLSELPRLSVVV